MYKIVAKQKLNHLVEKMVVHAPYVARKCEPGQFIILCANEGDERIPLTIQDYDREAETVSIIYQIVGYSTTKLAEKEVGDTIAHFAGPLGMPAQLHAKKRVLGIGGGVGAAPLYPQIKELKAQGVACDVILGGRDKDYVILQEEFKEITDNVYFATNDGSLGTNGFVTDVLNELLANGVVYDEVIAIGPLPMMKAVVGITKPLDIKTMVSLNPIMIDGTGMCGGCRVTVGGKTKFACVDGPDFDGFEVDFDEAMRRQNMYKKQEEHVCRMKLGGGQNA
ncbi:sulfide/dihydroorotate dehydrogenase-like FAD/NAD-binding protein [Niameybacter massiliensis]|uniref:Sulfide/dihydroorotate dehydrogenase-like FAD/NAD-binding protein n=1 Tax=Holtiella tumoricola TaxID=3018743 RepID=A0AA42DLN0_9FIRM|nr:sulfide/dihydroorotate dehydrogenase-like FAD/NAD-binding protein [Niameybacter massiliensis]MDA3731256.1 sulfide/dihydroorotate dehydrogenase-like FAD/NAD-binding protein [Holtiella tumoricola]